MSRFRISAVGVDGFEPRLINDRDEVFDYASRVARIEVTTNPMLHFSNPGKFSDDELEASITRCAVTIVNSLWEPQYGPAYARLSGNGMVMLEPLKEEA